MYCEFPNAFAPLVFIATRRFNIGALELCNGECCSSGWRVIIARGPVWIFSEAMILWIEYTFVRIKVLFSHRSRRIRNIRKYNPNVLIKIYISKEKGVKKIARMMVLSQEINHKYFCTNVVFLFSWLLTHPVVFVVFSEVLSSSTTRQASLGGGQVYGFLDQFGLFRYFGYVSNVQYPISNIFRVLTTQPTVPIRTITNTYEGGFVSEISRITTYFEQTRFSDFSLPTFVVWRLTRQQKLTLTWSIL